MPDFPQYQNAELVTSANYRTGLDANTVANSGDVLVFAPTAARWVTLPPVSLGGPVLVKVHGSFQVNIQLNAVDATNGVKIDGGTAGLVNIVSLANDGDQILLASDGSDVWWIIDKAHNTFETW